MDFTIEEFAYEKHMNRFVLMTFDELSMEELTSSSLFKDLKYTPHQVALDWLIGSDSCWVFLDVSTKRIVGITGAYQQIHNGEIVVTPWFLGTGFQRKPWNIRAFLRATTEILRGWQIHARNRLFGGTCKCNKKNRKFLKYLGFDIFDTHGLTFTKKGVTNVPCRTTSANTSSFNPGTNKRNQRPAH